MSVGETVEPKINTVNALFFRWLPLAQYQVPFQSRNRASRSRENDMISANIEFLQELHHVLTDYIYRCEF
jgi:hypothetical protein